MYFVPQYLRHFALSLSKGEEIPLAPTCPPKLQRRRVTISNFSLAANSFMKIPNSKNKKEKGPVRKIRKGPGRETRWPRLVGLNDDDLLGPAHHLRRFRDRILELVRALRDRLHLELLAVLGDLLGEPLHVVLAVHAGSVHCHQLRELLQQVGLALVARPGKLVCEQVVAGHEVQDVVHAVHVARRDEPTRGDAQHIAEMELLRLHRFTSLRYWITATLSPRSSLNYVFSTIFKLSILRHKSQEAASAVPWECLKNFSFLLLQNKVRADVFLRVLLRF
ncbi:MAG: hypothetical protein A3I89_00595 [Candidatus Harrisonbacteria bacterium RIFCSPLOWO2_02_FULL_41_11]|uniref:Uncharacterized protein n=1 Tax=Candidatus Harrisonbacteria bacterium RIFCSPHIGHO2_02_FULL_42_16 TaxID=1798404 RepID=A0A1G1ZH98_9BACT|nr:MAG: hypothetical protein A3B92_02400 [Candidatus Harrisonbacteria bacterium RIFCSPHIGHO2_02_FULL_42_16]OGY66494.1 MAG: hypothetical protein A3I89_00595 [Candidatus Harrisonbacteria bacterium RIFCSPLOWO2_02_FULL_41_11]